MKKKLITILVISMITFFAFPSYANTYHDKSPSKFTSTDGITIDMPDIVPDKYKLENKKEYGEITPKYPLYKFLNVKAFAQNDPLWANDRMKTRNSTISDEGCALTSVSMIFRYYGCMTNPQILNIDMGNYACPLSWYEAPERASYGFASGPELFDSSITEDQFCNYAITAIDEDKPIILGFWKTGSNGPYTHYVVITGYYNSIDPTLYDFKAIDPWGGEEDNLGNIVQGRSLYRAVVYSRN